MRVRFSTDKIESIPTESKRFAMPFEDLTDGKEYVVYALYCRPDGFWYLIMTDCYDAKNPNTYSSIPWYFHEAAFEIIDSHFSDCWMETKIEKDKEGETKDFEHPLMAEDPYFYGEWIDKESSIYFEKFAKIKKQLDAEDALRSKLLNIEKPDTKVVVFNNVESAEELFFLVKKNLSLSDLQITSWDDFSDFLLNIDFYVPEHTLWFLFMPNNSLSQKEAEKLEDILKTIELYWIEHLNSREFRFYVYPRDFSSTN